MQPVPRRLIAMGILLLGIGWIWLSRADISAQEAGRKSAPQVGFPAPDFSLETITGEAIQLSSLRGSPVVLNFWASWCPPCRAEMPALEAVHVDFDGEILVLGVNTASQDNRADMLSFIQETGLTFPILLAMDESVLRLYAITSLPTTYFIDEYGIIAEVVIGGPMTEAGLRARIQALLAEEP